MEDRMDVMLEFGGLWNLPTAIRIARAVEPYWLEDPFRMDNIDALAELPHPLTTVHAVKTSLLQQNE